MVINIFEYELFLKECVVMNFSNNIVLIIDLIVYMIGKIYIIRWKFMEKWEDIFVCFLYFLNIYNYEVYVNKRIIL